jgi:hypothetical protein
MTKEEVQMPNFEGVKSIEGCDKKILDTKNTIARKYKLRRHSERAKTDMQASYAEQIKHLKEELDHELEVLNGWESRRKVLSATGAEEDLEDDAEPGPTGFAPMPPPPPAPPSPGPTAVFPAQQAAAPVTVPVGSIPLPLPTPAIPPPPMAGGNGAPTGPRLVPLPGKRAAS